MLRSRWTRAPRLAGWLVVLCFIFTAFLSPAAQAGSAREQLSAAEDRFLMADFDGATSRIDDLLQSGRLTGDALRDAWVLKARCELATGRRASARDAFCRALEQDGGWLPDRDLFTSDELDVFTDARDTCPGAQTEGTDAPSYLPAPSSSGGGWYTNKLVWGAVGAAAVAGVALALSGGGDDGGDAAELPPLPDPPTN